MKKIILILSLLLGGCECETTDYANIVVAVSSYQPYMCNYKIQSSTNCFKQTMWVNDSCGVMQIGDTLRLMRR